MMDNGSTKTSDDKKKAENFLAAIPVSTTRDAQQLRLEAALIEAARSLRAARDRHPEPSVELAAALERCDVLLQRAQQTAGRGARFVTYDCLHQIERELVAAMSDEERRAALALYLAASGRKLNAWRTDAANALMATTAGEAPTVAQLQAVMLNVHAAQQNHQHKIDLVRQQMPVLMWLLIGAVVFFGGWALAGGFEWVMNTDDQGEVTLAMLLVTGVLLGFFGGLLSVIFGLLKTEFATSISDLRAHWAVTIARPFVGAAMAIPIAFFLQSGLLNLGAITPALALALCFLGGFSERWFIAQVERIAGDSKGRGR